VDGAGTALIETAPRRPFISRLPRVHPGNPSLVQAVLTVVAKTLLGGALVLVFASLSETLKPKRLAGLLAAAPSVAIAGLAIGAAAKGPADQAQAAHSMIAGAVGLAVCAAVAVVALRRLGTAKATAVSGVAWLAAVAALYPVVS
jgi:uncharacterized membrane protein (GlpM family)